MNVKIIKGQNVVRPDTTPLTSSIVDHATVVDRKEDEFGLASDAGLWPSYNCIDTLVPTSICPDPAVDKSFEVAPWMPGFTFAYQGGVRCKAVGLDVEDMKTELRRVFDLNEGRGIEEALLGNRFVATDSDATDMQGRAQGWDAPTDLTPVGESVSLAVALALLEGYAARTYAGVPTIHMPRAAASLLGSDKIVWEGDLAYTRLGSKIAMGGGYDTDEVDGTWDLYATGEVYIERGPQAKVEGWTLQGVPVESDEEPGIYQSNNVLAMVERMYRVGVDCFVAKATGTVW